VQEGLLDLVFDETDNCERYVQVVLRYFFPELTETMAGFNKTQLLPIAHMSMQSLSDVFGNRIINSGI
jgi:hypothetical protein